ncbi:MAG: competence/damage-inducible protein A [Acidobacteria bacterium]|nr:competence/damage-inducible protein A [Acidobacteriota bacterium]
MNCEIIAVGSEMLTPQRVDTNSLWLTDQLNTLGVEVTAKAIVGDDRARLADVLRGSLRRADLVLLSGGLGPTEDDITRDSVAEVLGRGQHFRPELLEAIAQRFRQLRRSMAENNKRQAYLIEGAEALANPRGTAPGQWIATADGRFIVLLPGPPHEIKDMYTEQIRPRLRQILPALHIGLRQFRVAGMGESDLDQLIAPVYMQYSQIATTVLAKPGDIQIHLRARMAHAAAAEAMLDELAAKIEELLGTRIYSRDGADLETSVGRLLAARGATVSVAESCTGGMLGQRFTSTPGSSAYFVGGFLTYTNAMKQALLGVKAELLAQHSAVSEQAAAAMARGAREHTGSSYALSVTGYAGPDGGTEQDPVGTIYLGLATPDGEAEVRRLQMIPGRERVRQMGATAALDMLRKRLIS